jgi:hypothetical protein
MDLNDIDLYERKSEEIEMLQASIKESVTKGDRYLNPFMILDTDYDNYLVTYRCR